MHGALGHADRNPRFPSDAVIESEFRRDFPRIGRERCDIRLPAGPQCGRALSHRRQSSQQEVGHSQTECRAVERINSDGFVGCPLIGSPLRHIPPESHLMISADQTDVVAHLVARRPKRGIRIAAETESTRDVHAHVVFQRTVGFDSHLGSAKEAGAFSENCCAIHGQPECVDGTRSYQIGRTESVRLGEVVESNAKVSIV